jgi:hypothetical protein
MMSMRSLTRALTAVVLLALPGGYSVTVHTQTGDDCVRCRDAALPASAFGQRE